MRSPFLAGLRHQFRDLKNRTPTAQPCQQQTYSKQQNRHTCSLTAAYQSTLCLKKVPTFKLSVTFSNLKRIFKILAVLKAYEIFYKTHTILLISP